MDIRNFFFSFRSYTPVPIGVMIIYFARPENTYFFGGITLLIAGELIRIWAVSHAGGETRTRNVGATRLCTSGPYAFVRNPLYVGNMLMYLGIVFIAGATSVLLMAATTFSFFLIQYSLIISLEEERLDELFGQEYSRYKENVPAVFPRIRKWGGSKSRKPTSIINTLKTEKRTLQNVAAVLILIFIRTQYYNG